MAIIFAVFGMLHFGLFILCLYSYKTFNGKKVYQKKDHIFFASTLILGTIISFFVVNHFALSITDASIMHAIGYSIIPITQVSLIFISYVLVSLTDSIKFSPIFLGLASSAPLTFLMTGLVGRIYWEFLGRSIYG